MDWEQYPEEERQEWLRHPLTKAFRGLLAESRQEIMELYKAVPEKVHFLSGMERMLIEVMGKLDG